MCVSMVGTACECMQCRRACAHTAALHTALACRSQCIPGVDYLGDDCGGWTWQLHPLRSYNTLLHIVRVLVGMRFAQRMCTHQHCISAYQHSPLPAGVSAHLPRTGASRCVGAHGLQWTPVRPSLHVWECVSILLVQTDGAACFTALRVGRM